MDWYDVDDILYDGDSEQISKVRCPDCGGHIHFTFGAETFTKRCTSCGQMVRNDKSPIPNCVTLYGNDYTI